MRPLSAPFLAAALCAASPLLAQQVTKDAAGGGASAAGAMAAMPARAVMLEDVERSRQNVLKYLDAAPDSMLGYRPMPGVRTFAQQIEHTAGANAFILGGAWKMPSRLGRDSTATSSKAALRAMVNRAYDEFARMVREVPESALAQTGSFANISKTNWRWVNTALEHATWTLGQTVPYLRANGVTPPQYLPF